MINCHAFYQVLRGAASRVGPLPRRLREGAHLKRGEVNDTTWVSIL